MQAKQGHPTLTYDIIGKKQMLQMLQVRQIVQESDSVAAEAQPPQQRHSFQPLYSADDVVAKHLQTNACYGGVVSAWVCKLNGNICGRLQAPCSCCSRRAARLSLCSCCTCEEGVKLESSP